MFRSKKASKDKTNAPVWQPESYEPTVLPAQVIARIISDAGGVASYEQILPIFAGEYPTFSHHDIKQKVQNLLTYSRRGIRFRRVGTKYAVHSDSDARLFLEHSPSTIPVDMSVEQQPPVSTQSSHSPPRTKTKTKTSSPSSPSSPKFSAHSRAHRTSPRSRAPPPKTLPKQSRKSQIKLRSTHVYHPIITQDSVKLALSAIGISDSNIKALSAKQPDTMANKHIIPPGVDDSDSTLDKLLLMSSASATQQQPGSPQLPLLGSTSMPPPLFPSSPRQPLLQPTSAAPFMYSPAPTLQQQYLGSPNPLSPNQYSPHMGTQLISTHPNVLYPSSLFSPTIHPIFPQDPRHDHQHSEQVRQTGPEKNASGSPILSNTAQTDSSINLPLQTDMLPGMNHPMNLMGQMVYNQYSIPQSFIPAIITPIYLGNHGDNVLPQFSSSNSQIQSPSPINRNSTDNVSQDGSPEHSSTMSDINSPSRSSQYISQQIASGQLQISPGSFLAHIPTYQLPYVPYQNQESNLFNQNVNQHNQNIPHPLSGSGSHPNISGIPNLANKTPLKSGMNLTTSENTEVSNLTSMRSKRPLDDLIEKDSSEPPSIHNTPTRRSHKKSKRNSSRKRSRR